MKRFFLALACLALGYIGGAFLGGAAVSYLSPNTHDLSVEAAMTGAFVIGPIVGILSVVIYLMASRRT